MGYVLFCEFGISYRNINVVYVLNIVDNWKCVERLYFVWVWLEDMVSKFFLFIEIIGVN